MSSILKVQQFSLSAKPEGHISYNINTKQLRVYRDNLGNYVDYDSFFVSNDVDALSINGYYPLYKNEFLANQISPSNTSSSFDGTDLGSPPPGIIYPLYMPDGLDFYFLGNHIDPLGDNDSDGILNFKDPELVGLGALLDAEIVKGAAYITPYHDGGGGTVVDSADILTALNNNPGPGSYNDTDKTLIFKTSTNGIMIRPNGDIDAFISGQDVTINPGDTLVYEGKAI
jgi:hypothetical protein